jgi:hypothetical protein
MAKTKFGIHKEGTLRVLRRARVLIDDGMSATDAFGLTHEEIEKQEDLHHD